MQLDSPSSDIDLIKYKESLKTFLRGQDRFKDYDFDGSNFDTLLTILAANAYNMAHYEGMVGNEAWVDTAELRQSLVSHATDLNYLPRSMTSAHSVIEVEIYPTDSPPSITLPKHYKFRTNDGNGRNIFFITDRDYVAVRSLDGRYVFKDVDVYQGELVEELFRVDGVVTENEITTCQIPFVISSQNIDIKSLEVFVRQNETSTTPPVKYTLAENLGDTTNQTTTYFLRGIYDNQYAIEFGDGTFGAAISNGNQIIAKYRNTLGSVIQGNYTLAKTTDILGYSDIVVNTATRVQGGFDRESVEEIRFNAPRHFQVQDRAVTASDYEVLIKRQFPNIQQVSAYGGEEVEQYGKVYIVLKPYGIHGNVSTQIKNQIIEVLKEKNLVPEPIVVDPEYYYIGITSDVTFEGDILTITEPQLRSNIINAIATLNDDDKNGIGNFNATLYQSKVNEIIKNSDRAIVGNEVAFDLRKRWQPALNINETLKFTTNNKFYKSKDDLHMNPDDYTLITNPMTIFLNDQISRVIVQDDGVGNLHYYYVDDAGNKRKTGVKVGTIDYDNGSILMMVNLNNYSNYVEVVIRLDHGNVNAKLNNFLIIDPQNINVNLKRIG